MAVVKMHKASDGTLHESFEAFASHEEKLKIVAAVKDVTFIPAGFEMDDRNNEVLHIENVGEFIAANAAVLRGMLATSSVSKRGRKAA